MRISAIIALALLLAGCNGDRLKSGTNTRQAQSQSWSPFYTHDVPSLVAVPHPNS